MRPSDLELLGIEGMQEAINSDNVAKVRRLCHRHAALAASQSIPLEFGGIFRLVMTDACRAGSDKVITWVVMFVVACCAIALPTFALIRAIRDRKLNSAGNKFKTVLSVIFAGVAFVVMLLAQVWLLPSLIP
jgi:hypothetical protein